MAAPFYSQADQDIYQSGNRFIPQEQYRLNYTPPGIMGQNTNAGIASTNLAQPYKGPPEGGGEGAGNISGTQQRSWSPNQNLGPTNITDYEAEAAGKGSTWRGSVARLQDAFSNLPLPSNLLRKGIRRWRENRDVRRAEEKIAAETGGADNITTTGGATTGDGGNVTPESLGMSTVGGGDPFYNKGGRIGYADRGFVDEDINIEGPGFDVNENLMASDPGAMDSLNEMSLNVFGKPLDMLTEEEYGILIDMANDQAAVPETEQGLASLV